MNVKLTPKDQLALQCFLADFRNPRMPKDLRVKLARFHDDVKRNKVNRDRFRHIEPLLRALHSSALTMLAQTCHYRRIRLWKRVLILPGILEWCFRVRPFLRHKRRVLNAAAEAVKFLAHHCADPQEKK